MTKPYTDMLQVNTISTREAAEMLGVSFPYLHNLISDEKLAILGRFGRNLILDRYQVLALKKDLETEKLRRPNDARLK